MGYHLRSDTLAGIKQSALFRIRDFGGAPLQQVVARLNQYMGYIDNKVRPDADAVRFYYANHVFSLIAAKFDPHEPMPKEYVRLARDYVKMSSDIVARLTYYTLLIITREMRHIGINEYQIMSQPNVSAFGNQFCKFVCTVSGHDEEGAVQALRNSPPDCTVDAYCSGMAFFFRNGQFSGSYGNEPWANIADTLRMLAGGEITPEMFTDTAWTLAHNNGPMFNKGMLYYNYSSDFLKLLDVQRAGQIPQLYSEGGINSSFLTVETVAFIQDANSLFPVELSGHVDWFKVEELGAMQSYPGEKAKQVVKYGHPYASEVAKAGGQDHYHVSSTEYVRVYQRKKAA